MKRKLSSPTENLSVVTSPPRKKIRRQLFDNSTTTDIPILSNSSPSDTSKGSKSPKSLPWARVTSHASQPLQFQCRLRTISSTIANCVSFSEISGAEYIPSDIRELLLQGDDSQDDNTNFFRIADFGNQNIKKIYQKPKLWQKMKSQSVKRSPTGDSTRPLLGDSQEHEGSTNQSHLDPEDRMWNNVPLFRVQGENMQSKMVLCFLSGLLTRKSEAAVIPVNRDYNFYLFAHTPAKGRASASFSDSETDEGQIEMRAVLVRRQNLILDLDISLIKARRASESAPSKQHYEKEFFVSGKKFYCCFREGAVELLQWACSVFRVYVFTNAIFEYAVEVCKLLDPHQKTLFKGMDLNKEYDLKNVIKSRELFPLGTHAQGGNQSADFEQQTATTATHAHLLRQKDFHHFGLHPSETVILDDDPGVWKQRENLLPFKKIISAGSRQFFTRCREEIWNLFDVLHAKRIHQMEEDVKKNGLHALQDDSSSLVYHNHSLESSGSMDMDYESEEDSSLDEDDL